MSHSIQDLLKNNTTLAKIIDHAQQLEQLDVFFSQHIPSELAAHCKLGCYEKGVLTLFAANGNWATLLRHQIPTLLSKLRTFPQWIALRSIDIKVKTDGYKKTAALPTGALTPLSENTQQQLQSLIQSLEQQGESALIKSLQRLANRLNSN